jgi:hypothetical protein
VTQIWTFPFSLRATIEYITLLVDWWHELPYTKAGCRAVRYSVMS